MGREYIVRVTQSQYIHQLSGIYIVVPVLEACGGTLIQLCKVEQ